MRALPDVYIETIGHSAGGKPIIAGTFGEPDDLPGRTSMSLASARGAKAPAAFYGQGRRKRQHVVFIGAAHGTEFEGTVAMLNVLTAIITGEDLRGRAYPQLHRLKDRLRITVIPFLNIDGRMRYPEVRHFCPLDRHHYETVTSGVLDDGTIQGWLELKQLVPQPLERVRTLGSYFNDAGINLVYDDFFGDPQPETRAMMNLCRREMPDAVLLSHSNRGTLIEHAVSYIPRSFQLKLAQLSGAVAHTCAKLGMTRELVARPEPYCGQVFYQSDALHHHCGTLPIMIEFPAGETPPAKQWSLDDLLDLGIAAIQEVLVFGDNFAFRPAVD